MNKFAVFYEEDGRITRVRSGPAKNVEATVEDSDSLYLYVDEEPDVANKYVKDGELVDMPSRPSNVHVFDYDSKDWGFALSLAKTHKWREIKLARDTLEFGGFVFDGNTFDSNQLAQQRIQNAMLLAMQDSSITMDWTLANNNTVNLNAITLINVGKALSYHVSNAHKKAQEYRAAINAASSKAEIDAITWS